MFNNKSFDVVGFDSCWQKERTSKSSEVQTDDYQSHEQESQTVTKKDIAAQTTNEHMVPILESDVDYDKLAAFLKRVGPKVLKELGKIEKIRTSSDLESLNDNASKNETRKLHTLQPKKVDDTIEMIVGGVSWSCSGSSLAFGHCCSLHDHWCEHRSQVVFFNIDRKDFSPSAPTKTIETTSCVTRVSFHPTEPSVLAVGTFSGEVLVWNLQKDDDHLLGSSSNLPGSHKDAVTQVSWVHSTDPTQMGSFSLVTTGRDGQVLVWQVKPLLGTFRLHEGFGISLDHGSHGRKVQTPMDGGVDNELGVTCFGFSPQERSTFVVGVEGGGILHCSTVANKPASVRSDIPLKDPVLSSFEGHQGNVTCVQFSTTHNGKFISCGIDQEIHIYQLEQASPVQVIYVAAACVGVAWCPTNQQLFATWGSSGLVEFYRERDGESVPSLRLATEEKSPISAQHFNPHSHRLLATGDVKGRVLVWEIPNLQSYGNVD